MRFLQKKQSKKTILVISDIHLGAGSVVNGRRNYLEDFQFDKELVDFLEYYSTGNYANQAVDLVINGDLFDFLAVPFVSYFDDEFWSEDAAFEKLKMIINAHKEVMAAFVNFVKRKGKSIRYILGNHDGEMIFPRLQTYLREQFPAEFRDRFIIDLNTEGVFSPAPGVALKHGHEYELAHQFDFQDSIVEDDQGNKYFIPPWGSYYVTRVINKFKEEREHINAVRPIKKFLINGLIYDTIFTLRFMFANAFYFIMVRFIYLFKQNRSLVRLLRYAWKELELFQDYESITSEFFEKYPQYHTLIVGHTHEPSLRSFANGTTFINTGTWTRMYHMDFGKRNDTEQLTYAQIDLVEGKKGDHSEVFLNAWKGVNPLPFIQLS